MSSNNVVLNNGVQAIINTDLTKIFLGNNRYEDATYNNSSYSAVDLVAGTLMGRVYATGKVVPLDSENTDGSKYPVGILANDYHLVDEGADVVVSLCIKGDVNESEIIFTDGDSMDTVVDSRLLRDRIASDTAGIIIVSSTEMTAFDNQ